VLLAVTPYIVGRIGIEAYGLWSLLTTLVRYGLVTDFGINPSIVWHVAGFEATGDRFSSRATLTLGSLYYAGVGAVLMSLAVFAGPALLSAVKMPPALHAVAPALLVPFVGAFVINSVTWVSVSSLLSGFGLMRLASAINALGTIVFAVSAVVLLALHATVGQLVIATYVQTAVCAACGVVALVRLGNVFWLNPFRIPLRLVKTVFRWGGWLQIGTLSNLVVNDLPPLLFGLLAGVQSVALFDLGSRLPRALKALSYNFTSALLPAIAAVPAEQYRAAARPLLQRGTRLMGVLTFWSLGTLVATGPLLLAAWLGSRLIAPVEVFAVLAVLSVVFTIDTIGQVGITGARGLGNPRLGTASAIVYAATMLVLCLLLVPHLGVYGVLAGLLAGSVLSVAVFFIAAAGEEPLRFRALALPWLERLVPLTALTTLPLTLVSFEIARWGPGRLACGIAAAALGLLYSAVFVAGIGHANVVTQRDAQSLRRLLPRRLAPALAWPWMRRLFGAT
jgi:O-antigen/teichoic acid export membrane protein